MPYVYLLQCAFIEVSLRLPLKTDRPRTQLLYGAELNELVQGLFSLAVASYTHTHIYISTMYQSSQLTVGYSLLYLSLNISHLHILFTKVFHII